jgi:hypothetical protein
MPPEQDDARARLLEALRRYLAKLGVQQSRPAVEPMAPPSASQRQRRPSLPWLLLIGVLVVVALVGGGLVGAVAWSDDRPAGSRTAGVSAATQRAAVEQGRILRDPANRRLSGREVLERVAPALQAGSSESARFNRALADDRQVVDRCKLQAP